MSEKCRECGHAENQHGIDGQGEGYCTGLNCTCRHIFTSPNLHQQAEALAIAWAEEWAFTPETRNSLHDDLLAFAQRVQAETREEAARLESAATEAMQTLQAAPEGWTHATARAVNLLEVALRARKDRP